MAPLGRGENAGGVPPCVAILSGMQELAGRTAVVTGGARGLGWGIARLFAERGAAVAIVDLDGAGASSRATELTAQGARALGLAADVSDEAAVEAAFADVAAQLGPPHVLVNNAGIDTTSTLVEMPPAMWDEMLRVNLRSVYVCTRAVLPAMLEQRYGRIISISSQLAHKGAATMAHYAAAKAGVIGFTRALAYEVSDRNVLVNAIAPGPLDTDLWRNLPERWRAAKLAEVPLGRPGQVEEIAPTALLLATERCYYQGATLNPNGGDVMV
jgi:3-oxoacyl-[acyl-carrier protein] reductase